MATATTLQTTVANEVVKAPQQMQWSDFNSMSLEARVSHTEIVTRDGQEWVTVNAITCLKDGTDGISVSFTNSNGILSLVKKGYLMAGRRVHITGTVTEIQSHYVDRDGVVIPLQRNRMRMTGVTLKLGATPSKKDA